MKPLGFTALFLSFVLYLILIPADLKALEPDTLLYDNFALGSTENWQALIGVWGIEDAEYCQLSCGG